LSENRKNSSLLNIFKLGKIFARPVQNQQ
jgi:hypothetical protein